ncbi:MAG: hypothetical protein E6R13_07355 [Spirochaetes bacterium]|nr:MAG: hypothetical protein E6R13_07355 [Spirochaetota bacterium]
MTYNDVLDMPVYERRFFLGLLTRDAIKTQERIEEMNEKSNTKNSKGSRTTKISGEGLKNRLKSGDIPLT